MIELNFKQDDVGGYYKYFFINCCYFHFFIRYVILEN